MNFHAIMIGELKINEAKDVYDIHACFFKVSSAMPSSLQECCINCKYFTKKYKIRN